MIYQIAEKLSSDLIEIRRSLHRIPETAFEEYKTSDFIKRQLEKLGLSYQTVCGTGIVSIINGKKGSGKTILIRADMDGLPIEEKTEVPFKSEHKGKMHACGHDVHITALLGVCMILKEIDFNFCGTLKAVFQPAEEGAGGAQPMIEKGIMHFPEVDAAIALHVEPLASYKTLQIRNGSIMSSPDDFKIIIKGVGGHGACPEKCINPLYAAAELIKALSTVVQDNFTDTDKCVVSVCTVNGGTLNNIIPDDVEITGTARSLDNDTRDKIEALILEYTKIACNKSGCDYEYKFNRLFPPVVNDCKMNKIITDSACALGCFEHIDTLEKASMTGDDFSYFAQLVPSAYFKLGAGNEHISKPLHSSEFNIDENCIHRGAAILTEAALKYLEGKL